MIKLFWRYIFSILILFFIGLETYAETNILIENLNEKFNIGKNQVNCLYQDSIGFVWFGMVNGLYKFDNTALKYIECKEIQTVDHPDIRTIVEFNPGILLLGTYDYGLLTYNIVSERFDTLSFNSEFSFNHLKVNRIVSEKSGIIWVATKNGLYKIRPLNKRLNTFELIQSYTSQNSELFSDEIIDIKLGDSGDLWIITMSDVARISNKTGKLTAFRTYEANTSFLFLGNNQLLISSYGSGLRKFDMDNMTIINDWDFSTEGDIQARYIYKDLDNNFWLSISNVGLFLLNQDLNFSKSKLISNSNELYNALNSNVILFIGEARDGALFVCTDAGVNEINQKNNFFHFISSKFDKNRDFNYGIRSLLNLGNNRILVGSMGSGLKILNPDVQEFTDIAFNPDNTDFAKNIQTSLKDKQGNLWLGAEGDGVIKIEADQNNLFKKPVYSNFRQYPLAFPEQSLLNDYVMCLQEDNQNNLWVGTWYSLGLLPAKERLKKDESKMEFVNFLNNPDDKLSISSNTIMCLLLDNKGKVWVGTQNGLNKVVEKRGQYFFDHNIKDEKGNSLNAKTIVSICQSKRGNIWFSTLDGGICQLFTDKMIYKEYGSYNGFMDYVVNSIQEDSQGNLWLGTGDGICRFDPDNLSYNLYKKEDGLPTNLFLLNSSCKVGNQLFFGGDKGIVYFTPENIKQTLYEKNLVLIDLKVFNKSIRANQPGSPLKKNISYTKDVDLKYNQNFVTFEFASLNFKRQKDIQYSCMLEGLETTWNNMGNDHKITYTNLSNGTYIFRVKAYDSGYHNSFEEATLSIKVHPPLWRTKVAYLLYMLIFIFVLYKFYTFFINQEKRRNALALEQLNAKKEHEIDLMKLRFFMNVSHEFRTPLTLLSAPLESLMKGDASKEKTKSYYQLMFQNVQRLKRLIDELLMLRKIDAGYLKMEWKLGNIIDFTRRIFDTFQSYADKRNMQFIFNSQIEELYTYFDADKLDKVLFNLLSNAFKYTENRGSVELIISGQKGNDNQYVEIFIKDTGTGISKTSLQNIFQRFQNTEKAKPIDSASTGIGLSLAKELIELHNGNIEVESEENVGSVFTIILPVYYKNPQTGTDRNTIQEVVADIDIDETDNDNIEVAKNSNEDALKPLVLIVEDNEDMRTFLANELRDHYEILFATNGVEGLEVAVENIPDLIVSDIMMDKMDGIALCQKIKTDEKTSHIPVILLTARHADYVKLDSYQIGADDFVTKPFNIEILKTRINNLIQQRRKLRAKFSLGIDNVPSPEVKDSLDSKFIDKLNKIINDNIDNTDFNPSFLASEMAMSRMQLYRKVTAVTDQTVNNYIRTIRLNRAANLLITTDLQIAEIAYKVGFSEPSNFTKSFSKHFNQTPSQFVSENRK